MSQQERKLECRRCRELVPTTAGSCPHCGASVRNTRVMAGVILLGVVIGGASLFNLSQLWVFGVVGVLVAVVASYLVYDKRQRTRAATDAGTGIPETTGE